MLMCGLVVTRALLQAPGAAARPIERARREEAVEPEQRPVKRMPARREAEADAEAEVEDNRDFQPELPFSPPIAPASRTAWRSSPQPARNNERAGRQDRENMREDSRDEGREPERIREDRDFGDGFGRDVSGLPSARLRAAVERRTERPHPQPAALASPPPTATPELIGVPVSAIEDFAHNLHAAGVDGSQIAVFAASPALDNDGVAIRFARALARDARVVLVALGAGDAAVREISTDREAPGLAALGTGQASFAAIITRDVASNLNLIAAGRNASRGSLLSAPGVMRSFEALTQAYPHVVIDGGALGGPGGAQEIEAIAGIATHALLLVETAAGYATVQARDSLLAAGFDNVTILIAGRDGRGMGSPRRFSSMSAAA
jgi:hypothetical protein